MLVDDLGTDRGMHSYRHIRSGAGEQDGRLPAGEIGLRCQSAGQTLAQSQAVPRRGGDGLVHRAAGLFRHAEGAVGEPLLHVFAGAPEGG